MILGYALAGGIIVSFAVAFVSVCSVLYNGAKLIGTYYEATTPRRMKLWTALFPPF